ncbi:MMPL family transporter [Halobacterium sp. R2-5]|uniref:efflux RND transporter permease subunit n=1 Tax=Halobacterium sp. R2-5 TaxID=2715751 RepID=UPI00141F9134|nr:MMPL family transporter [Halobacterium sp. R2-5]NIC00966.1 MMPL family transporter [Halobacterium sp. R2-5]
MALQRFLNTTANIVTTHNIAVIVVMLVLTAGVGAGITTLGSASDGESAVDFPPTTPAEKADYITEHYTTASDSASERAHVPVYVNAGDGENALSKSSLLASLRYQQAVLENESVASTVAADSSRTGAGIHGIPNLVAAQLADSDTPSLDTQIAVLADATPTTVERATKTALADNQEARQLLPRSYEAGSATAESHRMLFTFTATDSEGNAPTDATKALYETAATHESPDVFTLGEHALAEYQAQNISNTIALIVPVVLALLLVVLTFTYRDLVDVVVGMLGVGVSILWMFGILGWLNVDIGTTMIIGPVLIAGLSIDYGFHIFTRYREYRRPDEEVRAPMARSVRSVGVALGLVTVTTGIGFLSNVTNPVESIQTLGIGITLGVASALVVFVTLVPALKVTADAALERLGFDRQKPPLGESALLKPLLRGSVGFAKRAAPVVLVLAVLAGAAGGAAWTSLDEKPFDRQREPTADWKTDLPEPLGWERTDYNRQDIYVQEHYRGVADDTSQRVQLLVERDVTDDGALDAVHDGTKTLVDGGRVLSPVTVMHRVAVRDDAFAETLAAADTDGDGVPDENLATVYDALYAAAPNTAERVIERSPDTGEYTSLRVVGPADGGGSLAERADQQRTAATAIEDAAGQGVDLDATAVSPTTIQQAGIEAVTAGILRVMVLALLAITLTYVAVTALSYGSATLGLITVTPIALVVALVIAGMAILAVPLTLVTALLMSLTIGLGVDYNIHVTDRFVEELTSGLDPEKALETAVIGTGGALVGSALTTAIAFVAILLHPSPQLQNFGTLVVLALLASFATAVLVLPSLLAIWIKHGTPETVTDQTPTPIQQTATSSHD